jgi:hypothetical protein
MRRLLPGLALLAVFIAVHAPARGQVGPSGPPHAEFFGELPGLAVAFAATAAAGTAGDRRAGASTAPFWGELPDFDAIPHSAVPADGAVNLLVAVHRTGAQRYSDIYLTSGKRRKRPIATSMRLRRADDANFTNRTRFLARRLVEIGRPVSPPLLAVATTGEALLDAMVRASRQAPIGNMVIYGHAASNALFAREDRGFYASVMEVAKTSHIVTGTDAEKDEQLRLAGARDLSDLAWLHARGKIRFTRNPVIVFAGCGVAGKRDIDPGGIAARIAEITGAKVIASIDVTDQSMARGRDFRNHEYSRRTWVRFGPDGRPERLNTRVIDALKQLNFEGHVMAGSVPAQN